MDNKIEVIRKLKEKKPIYKISCEYYIRAEDKDMAEDFVNNEIIDGNFTEAHIIIEESDCKEEDIFNEVE